MQPSNEGYVCRTELPSQLQAKNLGKAGSFVIAGLLLARIVTGVDELVAPAAFAGVVLFLGMTLAPPVRTAWSRWKGRPNAEWETTLLWKAQTFAFGFVGICLVPAAMFPHSLLTSAISPLLMVLMFLATFTEFCLGRVAYMLLVKAGLPG